MENSPKVPYCVDSFGIYWCLNFEEDEINCWWSKILREIEIIFSSNKQVLSLMYSLVKTYKTFQSFLLLLFRFSLMVKSITVCVPNVFFFSIHITYYVPLLYFDFTCILLLLHLLGSIKANAVCQKYLIKQGRNQTSGRSKRLSKHKNHELNTNTDVTKTVLWTNNPLKDQDI